METRSLQTINLFREISKWSDHKYKFSPHDQAIPFLGIYTRELKSCIYTKTCIQMFRAVLFIVVKKMEITQIKHVIIWMKPENMLSENDRYKMSHVV